MAVKASAFSDARGARCAAPVVSRQRQNEIENPARRPLLVCNLQMTLCPLCAHGLVVGGGRTQWHRLSARVRAAADTCLLVPSGLQSHGRDIFLSAAQTICLIVRTARLSSVVVDAVELACAGIAHKARPEQPSLWPQSSDLSGRRHACGRRCRIRAASSAVLLEHG